MPRIINIQKGDIDLTRWVSKKLGFSNPIIGRTVNVSCDSTLKGQNTVFAPFDHILDPEVPYWNSYEDESQHWYQVDLQSLNIYLTGYAFSMGMAHYSRSWQVKGTNDSTLPEESWSLIDSKVLKQVPVIRKNTYSCDHPQTVRFIRFTTNELNFENHPFMTISKLYLYGNLIWSSCTMVTILNIKYRLYFFLLFLKN